MDIVITYVDGNDPFWKKDYEAYTNVPVMEKRFRDWGTLKYLLRGIEVNMPFIRNVYLVVSHPSQVPSWADQENLKIVLHKDIIPAEYLPTFNSTTIEMFLHRIEGLDEEYIYFNDDIFPVKECSPQDFFRDGKIVVGFSKHFLASGMYKKHCRRSDHMARKALGMKPGLCFVRAQHICLPLLRSQCQEVSTILDCEIKATLSRVRNDSNVNQNLMLDYIYYKGMAVSERIQSKHFSLAVTGMDTLTAFLESPSRKLCCINDVKIPESKYLLMRESLLAAFEKRFPSRSRFEK
jgi:hypothetical protein